MSACRITYNDSTGNSGNIKIPTAYLGREGTTYIYRGKNFPAAASAQAYGPRGLWMWAYKNPGEHDGPKLYRCPITVSKVSNSQVPAHNVSDGIARAAAASIALQGRFQGPSSNPDYKQYQFYPSGSFWEVHNHGPKRVGSNIARFTIGSLSELVRQNPQILINGTVPHLGSRVKIQKGPFVAIMVCIVATHFVVFALTYWLHRKPRMV